MKPGLTVILIFCWSILPAQRMFNINEFSFPVIKDTVTFKFNEDPIFAFQETVKLDWKEQTYPDITLDNQTFQSPLFHKGVIFVPNILDYAFDAVTGKKIAFGSNEARIKFKDFDGDTLVSYSGLRGFRTVVVNILTGKKLIELDKQPEAKAPFFLKKRTWLYVKWNGKSSTLAAMNLQKNVDIWSMPFQRFSLLKSVTVKECLFAADSESLYAIDYRSGQTLWKMPMKVNYINFNQNQLYIDAGGGLYCIDVTKSDNPKILWELASENQVVDISFHSKYLYIQKHNNLLAFDCHAKQVAWKANFYFNFYPADQLAITDDFVITTNTEDDKYNLIYDRKNGRLVSWSINDLFAYNFSKTGHENTLFAISDRGQWVYRIQISPPVNK